MSVEADLDAWTIAEAGRHLRARELSATELTRAALERIGARNAELNAFITVATDDALRAAAAADARLAAGTAAGPARRHPGRRQGRDRDRGCAHDGGVAHPRGLRPALRRDGDGAPQGGGRDHHRQDQLRRVRHGLVERETPPTAARATRGI